MAVFMNRRSAETIGEAGQIYMCGMNAHIAKPIGMREVPRLLKKYL